jgi:guanine deaminase
MEISTLESVLNQAIAQARKTMNENIGGPFGAAILSKDGRLLSIASNTVLRDHDPTAHAEINAIRQAGALLGTHDLTGCILIATAYPCPMCFSAIIWANIKEVYFGARPQDAAMIGFRDDNIYDCFRDASKFEHIIQLKEFNREACLPLFSEYQTMSKQIY